MPKKNVLFLIVLSQFFCTSIWFASNGVLNNLILEFGLSKQALGHLTSAVQLGFITGTLCYAVLTIADRYSPSKVFFYSALAAGFCNLGLTWEGNTLLSLTASRLLTGFFLAGIYPVGMKIAADYFDKGLGRSLSFLVGALVLGTALPHLLKGSFTTAEWRYVVITTTFLALAGGSLVRYGIPDGPFRKAATGFRWNGVFTIFKNRDLRQAAIGYFGHMWELYAFWAFVPVGLSAYGEIHETPMDIPAWSFLIIGSGALGCVAGGFVSERYGVRKTASGALLISCICCLLSPLLFLQPSAVFFLGFFLLWGMAVIADSPLFSTLVARNADGPLKGSALTLVNCIGFGITILSIQLLNVLQALISPAWIFTFLALGPLLGLAILNKKRGDLPRSRVDL
ncbi:Predicted arabinose efflux permease, MFS family [Muriicola jejuensis]|uniref:MFS transporter n=1 Tax=Muriicola jejuensis TaxID=504488 RepID=A0A6P0U7G1_9FLAO|nr:MFS transporter [Muriicola jejuensis]NER09024.1 MFS transporter [Muriicola jejuensis]SMP12047.1 Predicted arabinose efflux permease, MFS family [Muriicola jejuensis]